MRRKELTAALADIAAGQRGFLTRAQAVAAGADDEDLRRAVRGGWLERAGHGLYRVVGAGVRANDEIYAAWLRLTPGRDVRERLAEPDAIVAGASAAAVYGIGDVPERVHEFIVFHRTQTRDPDIRLHLRRDIGTQRWRVADDLPVQEPADAATWILDHGEGDPAHVGQLMAEAIATGLADPYHAAQALGPVARRWNVHVDTLLGDAAARALDSEVPLFREARLPACRGGRGPRPAAGSSLLLGQHVQSRGTQLPSLRRILDVLDYDLVEYEIAAFAGPAAWTVQPGG